MQRASLVVVATSHDHPSWVMTDSVAKACTATTNNIGRSWKTDRRARGGCLMSLATSISAGAAHRENA
jgi:hypothetical protein